jgi:hypothetical protein
MEILTNTNPSDTHEGHLAARAAELLPGIGTDERLELLGVMDERRHAHVAGLARVALAPDFRPRIGA